LSGAQDYFFRGGWPTLAPAALFFECQLSRLTPMVGVQFASPSPILFR